MANPVLSGKPPEATWLWNGLFAFVSCSSFLLCPQLAFSSALEPKAAEPRQWPRAKLPVRMCPESLITIISWFILYELKHTHTKKVYVSEVRPLRIGGLLREPELAKSTVWGWKALGPPPPRSPVHHHHSFKPTASFQKLPWLQKISDPFKRLSLKKNQPKTCFV